MQIINENHYEQAQNDYNHLIDIGFPPANMLENKISFTIRDGIEHLGFLMLGDLLVYKHETSVLEAHPFPEWVIQLHQVGKKSGKVFVILPKFSPKQIKILNRKSVEVRVEKTKEMLEIIFSYRNYALHNGFEAKIKERNDFRNRVQANNWSNYFFWATTDGKPHMISMKKDFINECFIFCRLVKEGFDKEKGIFEL